MNPSLISTKRKSLEEEYLDSPMHIENSSDSIPSTTFDVDLKQYYGEYIEYRVTDGKIIPIVREYRFPKEE